MHEWLKAMASATLQSEENRWAMHSAATVMQAMMRIRWLNCRSPLHVEMVRLVSYSYAVHATVRVCAAVKERVTAGANGREQRKRANQARQHTKAAANIRKDCHEG